MQHSRSRVEDTGVREMIRKTSERSRTPRFSFQHVVLFFIKLSQANDE
jgi:hypothetical protein